MKRKISLLIMILIYIPLLFISCTTTDNQNQSTLVTLPDLTDMSRAEIEEVMKDYNIDYFFQFAQVPCYDESDYDKFVEYSNGYVAGDIVDNKKIIYIRTTPLHLTINNLDKVKLDVDYEGKSFIDDGIGEVILVRSVDGDTARFIDPNSKTLKTDFSVRFLGIDTPESTREIDPWGKIASAFTRGKLENATTIVLEAEGSRNDIYGRYLAFVWVDGVLLNLELVQEAFSNATLSGDSKYFDIMVSTSLLVKKTGRRFYGEIDTTYNYN